MFYPIYGMISGLNIQVFKPLVFNFCVYLKVNRLFSFIYIGYLGFPASSTEDLLIYIYIYIQIDRQIDRYLFLESQCIVNPSVAIQILYYFIYYHHSLHSLKSKCTYVVPGCLLFPPDCFGYYLLLHCRLTLYEQFQNMFH